MIMGTSGRYSSGSTHDAPMSSCLLAGVIEAPGVGSEGAVDGVGQVALEGAEAGFAGFVLVLAAAFQQGAGARVAAGLDEGDAVDGCVELAVSGPVEAVGTVGTG